MKKKWFEKKPSPKYDIRLHCENFETEETAKKENKRNIKALLKYGRKKDIELAKWLKLCNRSFRCKSGACRICMRLYRIWLSEQMQLLLSKYENAKFVTIIFHDRYTAYEELSKLSVKRLKDRLRSQLRRVGICDALIVGGFEADLDNILQLWIPHCHFIIAEADDKTLDRLRKRYYMGNRRMEVDKCDGSAELFSYVLKAFFKYRNHPHGHKRLDEKSHIESLHFLSKQSLHDRAFLMGAKRTGSKIRVKK